MKTSCFCLGLAILCYLSAAVTAEEDETYQQAVVAFQEGKAYFEKKEYVKAADAFRKANRLKRSWKLLFNIGQCEAAARRYGLALDAFEEYLSKGGDEITDNRQQFVLRELSRLRKMIGFLMVQGEKGDIVIISDVQRTKLPQQSKLRVAMGPTPIKVLRGDDVVYEATIDILGGELTTLNIETSKSTQAPVAPEEKAAPLTPQITEEQAPAVSKTDTEKKSEKKPRKKRLWTWVALGIGGAAGVTGGALGGVALSKKNTFMNECGDDSCDSSRKDDRDSVLNMALAADILYGVAGVGIVTGVILFFLEPRAGKKKSEDESETVSLRTNGLSLIGSF